MVAPADKGGKVIIMDRSLYESKVNEHLKKNIENHTYYHWKDGNIDSCRKILEPKFARLRSLLNPFLSEGCSLEPEPYVIAKLYVLVKSHKDGIRPIIAAPDVWGGNLSKWLLGKLELISKLFDQVKVIGSEEFVARIRETKLVPESHKLTNWDYVSMFTNIPFYYTKNIIKENYEVIAKVTEVPVELFIETITFLVEDSSYFTYGNAVYRQTKGLTMGNRLSKMLAEITTNYLTMKALKSIEKQDITFLYKYVDDLVGALEPKIFNFVEKTITGNVKNLEVTRSDESDTGSVSFLDTLILKDSENGLMTKWWQKDCSSKQILNFHSAHLRSLKISVVREYIRHALAVTSPILYDATIKDLRKVLRRSSYPFGFIQDNLLEVLSKIGNTSVVSTIGVYDDKFDFDIEIEIRSKIMADKNICSSNSNRYQSRDNTSKSKFISFPCDNNDVYNKAKCLVKKHHVGCKLVPKAVRSNKNWIYSKMKDATKPAHINFGIFSLNCGDCGLKKYYRTFNLDLERTVKHVLMNQGSEISKHLKDYPDHTILNQPGNVSKYRNATELKLAYHRVLMKHHSSNGH